MLMSTASYKLIEEPNVKLAVWVCKQIEVRGKEWFGHESVERQIDSKENPITVDVVQS